MYKSKNLIAVVILTTVISLIFSQYFVFAQTTIFYSNTHGEENAPIIKPKNIFPTLVPTQTFQYKKTNYFLLLSGELLTPTGTIISSISVPINQVVPSSESLLILSNTQLFKIKMDNPSELQLTATNIIYVASDLTGYARIDNHTLKIYIYNTNNENIYQIKPPITSFSIRGNTLFLIKANILYTIIDGKINKACMIADNQPFMIISTASTTYLVDHEGISNAETCQNIIRFPEKITYIDTDSKNLYILTQNGNLYELNANSWKQLYTQFSNAKLLSNFVITPTATYIIKNSKVLYYSAWLKAYNAIDFGIYNGEPIVTLKDNLHIYISDNEIITTTVSLTKEDVNCKNLRTSYHNLIGCSPSFTALTTTDNTISIIDTKNRTAFSIDMENRSPIAYYFGRIYLIDNHGIYEIPIYKKEIILTIDSATVSLNGERFQIDVTPRILPPGRTFVPLRFISETLGATVTWDEDDRSITITNDISTIKLWIGQKTIIVNGVEKEIDAAPFIDKESSRTLVPLRFIAEYLGSFVYWIPRTRRVMIIQ